MRHLQLTIGFASFFCTETTITTTFNLIDRDARGEKSKQEEYLGSMITFLEQFTYFSLFLPA